jgi:hypothetical protein
MPDPIMTVLKVFAPEFDHRTWQKVQELVIGVIVAPGKRTVTAALHALGKANEKNYAKYHHVLNRAKWSNRALSERLLKMLVNVFCGSGPIILGIDEHIERRRGDKIAAKGIYRDPVRSSQSHFVKTSGLRWMCMMLLCPIPWVERIWALPFLTVLAPSERYYQQQGKPHKKLTDWARQMVKQIRRWLPDRQLVVTGDNSYAVIDLLHACQSLFHPVTFVTRLRLDAGLYEPAPPRQPGQVGRPRKKGRRLPKLADIALCPDTPWQRVVVTWYDGLKRELDITSNTAVWYHKGKPVVPLRWVLISDPLGEFEPQALLCTDQTVDPLQIIEWFVMRWQIEVTFEESRAHLGINTQRQWSDRAIERTTPLLLGLFSWVTLVANRLAADQPLTPRTAAWYPKAHLTFSDAIAAVRLRLWQSGFWMSPSALDRPEFAVHLPSHLVEMLCYAT